MDAVLHHYNLKTLFPVEWPQDKDHSESSDDEDIHLHSKGQRKRQSKQKQLKVLNRASSDRRSVPGAEKGSDGVETLVQRDEPDPLGAVDSVVRALKSKGLPVDENAKLRNRFLLTSTTFSPALYLSQVHSTASIQSLQTGAEYLSRSIDQKSASLKVLVESNFEMFVRAKSVIDTVYEEMKQTSSQAARNSQAQAHTRQTSRGSFITHARGVSGGGSSSIAVNGKTEPRHKNALTKEDEYGVSGVKSHLIEAATKADEIWGPALGGREREEGLKSILSSLDKYKGIYEVGGTIADCIKRKDYENLVEEYARARNCWEDANKLSQRLSNSQEPLSDLEVHQIIVSGKMWIDVEEQIEGFKRDVWRRLAGVQPTLRSTNPSAGQQSEEHMELISILLELGVSDNPIWVWLLSRYDHLRNKINGSAERLKVEIEIFRRRLTNKPKPAPQVIAAHLRAAGFTGTSGRTAALDSLEVIEFWEAVYSSVNTLLASQGGILGEVIDFWETTEAFIEGKHQRALPVGINGESQKHHRLSTDGVRDLKNGGMELVNMLRDHVYSFFTDAPIEDISLLVSPMPQTPDTPRTGNSLALGGSADARRRLDPTNIPPLSPKVGEAWEGYAFWPPHANSLSSVRYLSRILILVGTAASELAALSSIGSANGAVEKLRAFVSGIRERCVGAACAAWLKDAEVCRVLEDWTRSLEKRDMTKMPRHFMGFEGAVLAGMQKMLFISEAKTKNGSQQVVLPPPPKLLTLVNKSFVSSLYKALSGMVSNAQKKVLPTDNEWGPEINSATGAVINMAPTMMTAHSVNALDSDVRMILTLANLNVLRHSVVPALIKMFEELFSIQLTEESKTVMGALTQVDSRLFEAYIRLPVQKLTRFIQDGIGDPNWTPQPNQRPLKVRPYIYSVLLLMVRVHTQVSTTAASLTFEVLSYLLEQCSFQLLDALRRKSRMGFEGLIQATLDIEFMSQTLSLYTKPKAADLQAQIYTALDKGTDDESRKKLKDALPEMNKALKSLREASKAEFACFKKEKRPEKRNP
ncbi:MAG: hypothetical protein M1814_001006 [Vezdaea aestivalis]|nr:MAG: hypothetical protein M1814_001006 [Vezdaea aestivalis]